MITQYRGLQEKAQLDRVAAREEDQCFDGYKQARRFGTAEKTQILHLDHMRFTRHLALVVTIQSGLIPRCA
jgi:hypothetical protein